METNTHPLPILEWQAPIKVRHERTEKWYVVTAVCCALMIVYGILSGAWTMSLVFGMLAGLFYLTHKQNPHLHTISILDTGVFFGGRLYIWSECKQFWILRAETYHELHIEMKRSLVPDIVIQTGTMDPYVVRDTLAEFITPIEHRKEKILDAIIRFCKL